MRVAIRKKKIAKGTKYSVLLDYYANGLRKFETLNIHLYAKPRNEEERKHNSDMKIIIDEIRRKRENESQAADFNIEQVLSKKGNFLDYYQTYVDKYSKKDSRMVKNSQFHFVKFIEKYHNRKSITGELYVRPADVKKTLCVDFKEYLSDECGLNGETPANYFARFRKVLKKAVDDGIFIKNPAEGIINRIDKNSVKKDVLTSDEIKKLFNTTCGNEEIKKSFLFGCFTGFRPSDIYKLKWKNVVGDSIQMEQSKTGVVNKIKLKPEIIALIGKRGKPDDNIFNINNPKTGKLITLNGINTVLDNWVKKAGIEKNITAYCSRHSFGTNIYLFSKDIKSASQLLGHTSLEHTIKYVRKAEQLENDAIDKLPGFI